MRVVGLMSGTSLDGIDAALVDVSEGGNADAGPEWRLSGLETVPYSAARREEIHGAILRGEPAALTRLHARLGEWFAAAVQGLCDAAGITPSQVDLIGCHGQTIWHEPPRGEDRGATLQLGDPATLAERTGIPVVSDFRSRDMAAGGEGAPLVPWVDALLFAGDRVRILQNIGGMANLTRVPARGSGEGVVAFDTGPGNALLDAAVELATDGRAHFDRDGLRARKGRVDEMLLAELLDDPYFRRPPPKSTGRERFGRGFVQALVARIRPTGDAEWADLIATLTALTARSVADAVERWAPADGGDVIVTGGGARNPALVERLADALAPVPVRTGEVLGIDPDAKEALAFAILAWAHVRGRPANVPGVTGAAGPRVLGSYTPGDPRRDPGSSGTRAR
ncbi:MAG: anhydro-N-acetylmuramic acid kinase [Gemmatimonadota bacterium]